MFLSRNIGFDLAFKGTSLQIPKQSYELLLYQKVVNIRHRFIISFPDLPPIQYEPVMCTRQSCRAVLNPMCQVVHANILTLGITVKINILFVNPVLMSVFMVCYLCVFQFVYSNCFFRLIFAPSFGFATSVSIETPSRRSTPESLNTIRLDDNLQFDSSDIRMLLYFIRQARLIKLGQQSLKEGRYT